MKHDQAAAAAHLAHMLRWLQDDAARDVCTAAGRVEWADSDFAPG